MQIIYCLKWFNNYKGRISNEDITPSYKDIQMPSILEQFRVNNISQIMIN